MIIERSGLGQCTYVPKPLSANQPIGTVDMREESEMVVFGAIDDLFDKTTFKNNIKDIRYLILNSSLFSPTPSLSETLSNRYQMGEDLKVYNLSGMGCGAGLISVDLTTQLLKVHRNSYALVVSTENITQKGYY
ncbi:putative very-long-chain 3-oxoacyl-CoA synthase [Dioscorea sansibarensis]